MAELVVFHVPGKPVGKARPRFTRSGRTYTPKRTKEQEELIRASYLNAYREPHRHEGMVQANLTFYFKPPKSMRKADREKAIDDRLPYIGNRDADNLAKAVLDSLNTYLYADDRQIVTLIATKRYGSANETCCMFQLLDQ